MDETDLEVESIMFPSSHYSTPLSIITTYPLHDHTYHAPKLDMGQLDGGVDGSDSESTNMDSEFSAEDKTNLVNDKSIKESVYVLFH